MGTGIPEDLPNPDLDDLQQRELPLPALLVRQDGPVHVHELPSRVGACFTQLLGTGWENVLSGPDPKRKRALLFPSAAVYIGTKKGAGVGGCLVPAAAASPIEIRHQDAVWIRMVADTGTVGVIVEVWAD